MVPNDLDIGFHGLALIQSGCIRFPLLESPCIRIDAGSRLRAGLILGTTAGRRHQYQRLP